VIVRAVETDAELAAALALREEVFCGEQGVSLEVERDGLDATALHLGAFAADGALIGTCRLRRGGDQLIVQRVAVRREDRGLGVGAALLAAATERARELGARELSLHAQLDSERFYRRQGYEPVGETFVEAGIEHLAMRRLLEPS
jgi:predicted GNAT family N-acyltransferase